MISALAEGKEHVPFRETKLTRLLQDSLVRGGGGTTGLLVALNPTHAQLNESEGETFARRPPMRIRGWLCPRC